MHLEANNSPFLWALGRNVLPVECTKALVAYLDHFGAWVPSKSAIARNSAYYLNSQEILTPPGLRIAVATLTPSIEASVASAFKIEALTTSQVMLNRWLPGDYAHPHTDAMGDPSNPHYFSHRALLYLTPTEKQLAGGDLVLHGASELDPTTRRIRPDCNTLAALAMSPESVHSVDKIVSGTRYSIVWSLRPSTTDRNVS